MVNTRKQNIAETIAVFLLIINTAFIELITTHIYSTRIIIGLLLVSPMFFHYDFSSIEKDSSLVKTMWVGNILISVFYLLSGIVYKQKAYILIAIVIGLIVPIMQTYVLNRNETILDNVGYASLAFICLLLFLSFLCGSPITVEQYAGVLSNQNTLGVICITILPAGLHFCRQNRFFLGLPLIGIVISFTLFSTSRTAIIAIMLQLIYSVFTVVIDILGNRVKAKDVFKRTLLICITSVFSFFLLFWLFTSAKEVEAKMLPGIQIKTTKEDVLTLGEMKEKLFNHLEKGLDDEGDYSFTSGRIGIWKDYAKNIRFIGHEKEERDQLVSGSRLYVSTNAHNAYLQLAYGGGVLAGVGLLWVAIMAAYGCTLESINGIRKRNISEKTYYSVLIVLGYGIVSLTSSSWMMYVHFPALAFWPFVTSLLVEDRPTIEHKEKE